MDACENCGWDGDDELVTVRRVYLDFEELDAPPKQTVVEIPERWCVSCVTQYPCELVELQ